MWENQAYEKSEDPIYVLENNIPIDPQYYLENQISKVGCIHFSDFYNVYCSLLTSFMLQPILRIFEPILKNASKELLHGSHTRSISISTPSNSGIMRFAQKQYTCIGCKALLRYIFSVSSLYWQSKIFLVDFVSIYSLSSIISFDVK